MPGGHRGQQCKKKGLTQLQKAFQEMTMTCLRFMFLLCQTFQACAVATTKSDV